MLLSRVNMKNSKGLKLFNESFREVIFAIWWLITQFSKDDLKSLCREKHQCLETLTKKFSFVSYSNYNYYENRRKIRHESRAGCIKSL